MLDTVALDLLGAAVRFTDAVAIDNRERTRSKGYVVPACTILSGSR